MSLYVQHLGGVCLVHISHKGTTVVDPLSVVSSWDVIATCNWASKCPLRILSLPTSSVVEECYVALLLQVANIISLCHSMKLL